MIMLHRLGHQTEPFFLTPDLIVTVEANPDTVITLTTGAKLVVVESPETIVTLVQDTRVNVLVDALDQREREREGQGWPTPTAEPARLAPPPTSHDDEPAATGAPV
jgi:flagellar protein FlbD